jgi:hypothetical protein
MNLLSSDRGRQRHSGRVTPAAVHAPWRRRPCAHHKIMKDALDWTASWVHIDSSSLAAPHGKQHTHRRESNLVSTSICQVRGESAGSLFEGQVSVCVCTHGTPDRCAAACNEHGRRSGAQECSMAIRSTYERTRPFDRWDNDAGGKSWRPTASCLACPAVSRGGRWPARGAHSERPSGKTNRVTHSRDSSRAGRMCSVGGGNRYKTWKITMWI